VLLKRRVKFEILAAVAMAATLVVVVASPLSATGILPPLNPTANIAPKPDFYLSGRCTSIGSGWRCPNPCVDKKLKFPAYDDGQSCAAFVLRAVNAARAAEQVPAMVLPTNWQRLSAPEQLFVLADLERTARGLPPFLGLNRVLSQSAQRAALLAQDPQSAPGFAAGEDPDGAPGESGILALAQSTLEADYGWMYDDGWGGSVATTSNFDCTSALASSCWGHRDALLGLVEHVGVGLNCTTCEMGAGFALVHGHASFTGLLELPAGAPPPMYFTWAHNVVPYLAR
jgi:hypothetical protein